MRNVVWIVEMRLLAGWQPTVGTKLSRDEGRSELRSWQRRNPDDKFRLRKYISLESHSTSEVIEML